MHFGWPTPGRIASGRSAASACTVALYQPFWIGKTDTDATLAGIRTLLSDLGTITPLPSIGASRASAFRLSPRRCATQRQQALPSLAWPDPIRPVCSFSAGGIEMGEGRPVRSTGSSA